MMRAFVLALLVALSPIPVASSQAADPFSAKRLYRCVETYYKFGIHRTGTSADQKTGDWLHRELKAAKLNVSFHEWTVPQFFLSKSAVEVGKKQLECMPYWLPKPTGPKPVRAPLVLIEKNSPAKLMKGRIALIDLEWIKTSEKMNGIVQAAHKQGAQGIVFVSDNRLGLIKAMNSKPPYVEKSLPLPAVIVSRRHLKMLTKAADLKATVGILIQGELREKTKARNVIGKLQRGDHWIVISTPYSGWHRCAGERGSGIAIWLALAEWAAKRKSKCSFLFVANSGHELGFVGAERTLHSRVLPRTEKTICWLHLGANIGVARPDKERKGTPHRDSQPIKTHVMASPAIKAIVAPFFKELTLSPKGIATKRFFGEVINVNRRGYPVLGLIFGAWLRYPRFHTNQDNLDSVKGRNLAVIAAAIAKSLEALDR